MTNSFGDKIGYITHYVAVCCSIMEHLSVTASNMINILLHQKVPKV